MLVCRGFLWHMQRVQVSQGCGALQGTSTGSSLSHHKLCTPASITSAADTISANQGAKTCLLARVTSYRYIPRLRKNHWNTRQSQTIARPPQASLQQALDASEKLPTQPRRHSHTLTCRAYISAVLLHGQVLAARLPQSSAGGTNVPCAAWDGASVSQPGSPLQSLPEQAKLHAPAWYFGRCSQLLCSHRLSSPQNSLESPCHLL